jgi:superfamily I DNA/RNA helicase
VEQALDRGVSPDRIGFVSFTRKAAEEAADRAGARFKMTREQMPYFRTLHSLGHHQLGLGHGSVLSKYHLDKIGQVLGLTFSHQALIPHTEIIASKDRGDIYMGMLSHARSACITLEDAFRRIENRDHRITFMELERMAAFLDRYKEEHGIFDYADMIDACTVPLDLDILIIDEAQDLSTAQWRMLDRIAGKIPDIYFVGDEMQSIYTWAGADVHRFINEPYDKTVVLEISYRLPESIWAEANRVELATIERIHADWRPTLRSGNVTYHNRAELVPIDEPGSWLLLARNNYMLGAYANELRVLGLPYTWGKASSIKREHQEAIKTWGDLVAGKHVKVTDIQKMLPCIASKTYQAAEYLATITTPKTTKEGLCNYIYGLSEELPWYRGLTGINIHDSTYYRAILRQKSGFMVEPRHHLGTIHSVKGGEADNVVLLTDISPVTQRAYVRDTDAENRVFFVGMTRAKQHLHIVLPQTRCYYRIP